MRPFFLLLFTILNNQNFKFDRISSNIILLIIISIINLVREIISNLFKLVNLPPLSKQNY